MSDPLAIEKVDQLEARLSAALARIDAAMGKARAPANGTASSDELSDLREELALEQRTRLDLAARLKAMEAQAQGSTDGAELRAAEAEAARDSLKAELAAARAEVEQLKSDLAQSTTQAEAASDAVQIPEATGESEVQILRMRAARLREERNEARDERDAARDALEDRGAQMTDSTLGELRATIARLQETLEELREAPEGNFDRELLQSGLLAEIRALKAQRAADAQELAQILAEIDTVTEEGGA